MDTLEGAELAERDGIAVYTPLLPNHFLSNKICACFAVYCSADNEACIKHNSYFITCIVSR